MFQLTVNLSSLNLNSIYFIKTPFLHFIGREAHILLVATILMLIRCFKHIDRDFAHFCIRIANQHLLWLFVAVALSTAVSRAAGQ
jgi:hypothetical protein